MTSIEPNREKKKMAKQKAPEPVETEVDDLGFKRIAVDDVEFWDLNPNEEDPDTFNLLVSEIKEDNANPEDMDQPLVVIPHPEKKDKFIVMSGNHRLKAVKLLGAQSVLCRIKDWDEKTAIEKAVRRNLVSGKLNEAKFTKMVNQYTKRHKVDVSEAPGRLGFVKEAEFYKHYKRAKDKAIKHAEDKAKGQAKEELNKIENLSFILNKLFREYGDTLENQFMFFTFGNKLHLMVHMDGELSAMMDQVTEAAVENGIDVNRVLKAILAPGVEGMEDLLSKVKNKEE